jgi:nucleotide-binding universal stress UspA family protein
MLNTQTLLLAHHGSAGALLAETLALDIATPGQTQIVHLLVVPDLWSGMQGDDWLNNSSTRDTFGSYVEGLLEKDVREQLRALEARCAERGYAYRAVMRQGDPAECLLEVASQEHATLVVIGPPRAKGVSGIRSRMDLEKLARGLHVPLLMAARAAS